MTRGEILTFVIVLGLSTYRGKNIDKLFTTVKIARTFVEHQNERFEGKPDPDVQGF